MSYNPNFSGTASAASSKAIHAEETNNSGSTINKLTPVRIDSNGDIATVDVAIEAQALAIAGITDSAIGNGAVGAIVNSGRILDITTTASLGEALYVSKVGTTTNLKPTIGIDGFMAEDFVIRLGIIAKNALNPVSKDLLVNISIVGQL